MARLKTHTKVLLSGIILMAVAAVSYQGYQFATSGDDAQEVVSEEGGGFLSGVIGNKDAANAAAAPVQKGSGPLASKDNPLKVNINTWIGWGPGLLANGGLTTTPDSLNGKSGLYVTYTVDDSLPPLAQLFESGAAHCGFRTTDWLAQEHPAMQKAGHNAKAIIVADNSRGGDALIAKSDIGRVEDLAGRRVGFTKLTVSQFLLGHYALNQSSLTDRKKQSIEFVAMGSPTEVREAFEQGSVDAAFLWEPDTSLAISRAKAKNSSAHVIFSTATATNTVYDHIVCDTRLTSNPANDEAFTKFVGNWFQGVDQANANINNTAQVLTATMPSFATLANENGGVGFISGLFNTVLLTGLEENIRTLGLAGGTDHIARVYSEADGYWREYTQEIPADAPRVNPADAFEPKYVRSLMAKNAEAKTAAAAPEFTFTKAEQKVAVATTPVVTKPVTITFPSGQSSLTEKAKQTLRDEVVPLLESMGSAYFSVEGNTDAVGAAATNKRLSQERADAVVQYLVVEWEFPAERFQVKGNGPAKPACNEAAPEDGVSLDGCRELNRRTDVAVFSR